MKMKEILVPIAPSLVRTLKERNIALDSETCKVFFRWLIENYLQTVLGRKMSNINPSSIRKLGCGKPCHDCQKLDNFITSTENSIEFRELQAQRKHLENQVNRAPDIVTHRTNKSGRPYGLIVTKRKEITQAIDWITRQKAANEFLKTFEGGGAIGFLLGPRLPDMKKALLGEKAYVAGTYNSQVSAARPPGAGSATAATTPAAGVKRKNGSTT